MPKQIRLTPVEPAKTDAERVALLEKQVATLTRQKQELEHLLEGLSDEHDWDRGFDAGLATGIYALTVDLLDKYSRHLSDALCHQLLQVREHYYVQRTADYTDIEIPHL
jgi:hypothetical protein